MRDRRAYHPHQLPRALLFLKDPSFYTLVAANIGTIYFAIRENWPYHEVLWIYWFQSVIIGLFNTFRVMLSPKESGGRFKNIAMGIFFLFHYGFFHVVYAIFLDLYKFFDIDPFRQAEILYAIGLFAASHLVSFIYYFVFDHEERLPTEKQMMVPYRRIIPMHLTIIFSPILFILWSDQLSGVLFFLSIKSIADVVMHVWEHNESS